MKKRQTGVLLARPPDQALEHSKGPIRGHGNPIRSVIVIFAENAPYRQR